MQLTGDPISAGQPLYTSSSTQIHRLGERLVTADGRVFRYCKAASTAALVAGNYIQSAAEIGDHQNRSVTAAAIGATTVTVSLGATAVTENQYAGGQMVVTITPGLGQAVTIAGHPAAVLSTSVVLTLGEPLRVALDTNTRVDLVANPYNNVIQEPATTATGVCVGVATYIISASEYGWIQRGGLAGALNTDTTAVGLALCVPSATVGAAKADPANAAVQLVGTVASTCGTGECNGVLLAFE